MTASPPPRPTPPIVQRDEPEDLASTRTSQQQPPMQNSVPERPKSASQTMPPAGPRSGYGAGDPDHASRHDEYEVVEVDDDETGVEEVPRRVVRPPLPRLNSSSRAPPSPAAVPETSPPQPPPRRGSNTNTPQSQPQPQQQPQPGGPSHLQASREIPIPMGKFSTQAQSTPKASAASPGPVDDRTDESSQEAKPSSTATPKFVPKEAPQGKNEPIQIPKVTPIASGLTIPPNLAQLAKGLDGKYVDEFGNILEWDGQVLGRVEGDLPSMIGRPVSVTGEILSEDGEVVGYVAENDTIPPTPPSPRPIEGMGDGLKVDHMGNILDKNNNVVGHFDGAPLAESLQRAGRTGGNDNVPPNGGAPPDDNPHSENCSCGRPKPSSAPKPSEVFLDVKSTHDGIQLIIKIPTVFNNGGTPNIHIGTG
ncbi:hypothetical protein C8035_v008768 [Colletotrichum spinosum]|uniref:LEA domain protein n=1 Tax=Colletotrichum spinosum TaxID=1347390 RepID=A0A4R8QKJ4_9PEZI|nr:hypothetical protein C8035_v008768 [Colletotrichum spinosum]